ncbi:MAG: pyruvate dehydrogenase (acetyl-transferring) E1 component subunit alpha [Sulfobacillus acidophilus]|uniref:Pyruvate dehydrogenase E1 component subunit alpha n=1 Tax=Sulfobacillus acidophilus TaxID=53633 RepID=A0A2T2WL01_9FIRM|nr:MAG: pyruvate dehydrogenase (acetyl-transferring) E1 component subunit alpha [Sulfobacillus acidophilus]
MNPEQEFPIRRVIDEQGQLVGDRSQVSDAQLKDFYQWLVTLRQFDQRAWNLQRQGRIGTYPPYSGQEATQVGVVAALSHDDWICGSYRDWAALAYAGVPLHYPLLNSMGHAIAGHIPEQVQALPVQVVIAAQILHAVGLAWAAKLQEQNRVAVTFFGDGATSQGDFHEALNLASVMQVPVIFVCENNQWAISVPLNRQMHSPTIAQRALAYNIEGIRLDGNDIVAVYQTMREVVERVRSGQGPVLIEAVTYRLGAHTTADDPTRYRPPEEDEQRRRGEPLSRLQNYLQRSGLLSQDDISSIDEMAKETVDEAVQTAEAYPAASLAETFEHVYGELSESLREQRAASVRGGAAHG